MAKNDIDASLINIHNYVYEGIWEKYGETWLQRWIWTLSNVKAGILLGGFGLLLTFSQSRSWFLIRYVMCLMKRTVRLDSNDPEPLQHLSQSRAILDVLPFFSYHISRLRTLGQIFRLRRKSANPAVPPDSPVISPWFGFFAALNLILFVVMGVAIPWQLSEGVEGRALVRSRVTDNCSATLGMDTNAEFSDFQKSIELQQVKTDGIFQICQNKISHGCASEYYLQQPQITRRRIESCIFPANICYNGTRSFEITHWNITASEVGLNSKSRVAINHRLTCTPVHLDSFLRFDKYSPNSTVLSIASATCDERSYLQCRMTLHTMNGPNSFTHDSSGYRMAMELGSRDISVLPRMPISSIGSWSFVPVDSLHEELRRNDGASFVVIYRAGKAFYLSEIDDPFFAAHYESRRVYYADHEATGLGCLEQFQFYTPKYDFSTSWGLLSEQLLAMREYLDEKEDSAATEELSELEIIPNSLSIHDYLIKRPPTYYAIPLTHQFRGFLAEIQNTNEQWITEVETWFMKGIVKAILYVQGGARFKIIYVRFDEGGGYTGPGHVQDYSFCDRILFYDGNHTNISWVGFWIATLLLTLLCLASFAVRWLDTTTRSVFKAHIALGRFLLKRVILMARVLKAFVVTLRSRGKCWIYDRLSRWWLWAFVASSIPGRAALFSRDRVRDNVVELDGTETSDNLVYVESRSS